MAYHNLLVSKRKSIIDDIYEELLLTHRQSSSDILFIEGFKDSVDKKMLQRDFELYANLAVSFTSYVEVNLSDGNYKNALQYVGLLQRLDYNSCRCILCRGVIHSKLMDGGNPYCINCFKKKYGDE